MRNMPSVSDADVQYQNHILQRVSRTFALTIPELPASLSRVVGNLVDNAVRHARRVVTLDLREDGVDAVLTVTDDGPGIPADQHERIFDRFARVDGARVRDNGGSGLGLAITRDLVERHGGTVRVEPGLAEGARFVVRLPLA